MTNDNMTDQEELKRFLTEEMTYDRNLDNNEAFKTALKKCTDDELLYLIAENAPQSNFFSFGDIAAAGIRSDEYRYALISSSIRARRTLIHDLAVSRELDELLAVRILLTDSCEENKREAMYVIKNEALLMLAFLKSFSYRRGAKERLKEIGSVYPERYFTEMEEREKETIVKEWHARACEYAERLIEIDKDMDEKLSDSVEIDSELLIGFLAACHPDAAKRAEYAKGIPSQRIAAYAGVITEYADVRRLLSCRIQREDLLDELPYCDSGIQPFLLKDTSEKRTAFCLEVLRNTDNEEVREYLTERMENAGIEIPE